MYFVGVDLGGTNIAAGIADETGNLMRAKSVPTFRERDAEEIAADMAALCERVIQESGVRRDEVKAIGVGTPGTVNPEEGVVLIASNLRFRNVNLKSLMARHTDLPIFVENDANCAALGEARAGAAVGYRHSVTVTIGTGVGAGIIIDGKIYGGAFYGAGELGHHCIRINGELCTCGRKGCWEAYASASALIRDAKIAVARNPFSKIPDMVGGEVKRINAKTPFDAAEAGDESAIAVIDRYLTYVSEGLANVINIFQPEIVVIGGGVCYQGDRILLPIREKTYAMIYGRDDRTKIEIAQLGNDAGIIGAAMLGNM